VSGIKNISLNKKNAVFWKFFVGAIVLLFFVAVLNFFDAGIKNIFYAFTSPVQKTFWLAGESASEFVSSFTAPKFLLEENETLKNENHKLLSEITFLQTIVSANKAQGEVSLAYQNSDFQLLMAGVIGSDGQDELSINKGSDDGILEDMPVINQQQVLFGKVFEVYKNFSRITLISNKNSVVNVKIQQADTITPKIDGVVKGKGGFEVFLDLVPIDETINKGDVLVTSSLEGTFPKDLLVGRIDEVEKNDQNPHQQAKVKPFLDVSTDNLFVITNYKR